MRSPETMTSSSTEPYHWALATTFRDDLATTGGPLGASSRNNDGL